MSVVTMITLGSTNDNKHGTMASDISGHFYYHGLTLIPPWISNYTHYNVWDEITYPFLNFNSATVEV